MHYTEFKHFRTGTVPTVTSQRSVHGVHLPLHILQSFSTGVVICYPPRKRPVVFTWSRSLIVPAFHTVSWHLPVSLHLSGCRMARPTAVP